MLNRVYLRATNMELEGLGKCGWSSNGMANTGSAKMGASALRILSQMEAWMRTSPRMVIASRSVIACGVV